MGTVPNNPALVPGSMIKGMINVNPADTITEANKYLLERNPTLNALRLSDRQFHTTNNSCRVARIKAIVLAYANCWDLRGS